MEIPIVGPIHHAADRNGSIAQILAAGDRCLGFPLHGKPLERAERIVQRHGVTIHPALHHLPGRQERIACGVERAVQSDRSPAPKESLRQAGADAVRVRTVRPGRGPLHINVIVQRTLTQEIAGRADIHRTEIEKESRHRMAILITAQQDVGEPFAHLPAARILIAVGRKERPCDQGRPLAGRGRQPVVERPLGLRRQLPLPAQGRFRPDTPGS